MATIETLSRQFHELTTNEQFDLINCIRVRRFQRPEVLKKYKKKAPPKTKDIKVLAKSLSSWEKQEILKALLKGK